LHDRKEDHRRVNATGLLGGWHLERWSLVHEDGPPPHHPLGPDAKGFILYTQDGYVSATLLRSTGAAMSFAYAGRYEVRDGAVYHSIEVATDRSLVGITSTRHIALDGDRLTLSGPDFSAGSGCTQKIVWRRAP
jgi:hypothetical protein